MTHARTAVVLLVVLGSLTASVGVVAGVGDTEISVTPENGTIAVGDVRTVSVVVTNATADVKGYDVTINLSDGTVATIENVTALNDPRLQTTTISNDNDSAFVEAGFLSVNRTFDTRSPAIITLEIRGESVGVTDITVSVEEVVADLDGETYNVTATNPATLTVETGGLALPGYESVSTNLDDDPLLEDVDGDGDADVFDALTYYNNRNSDVVQNNPTQFDYDGNAPPGTIFDALELYNEIQSL